MKKRPVFLSLEDALFLHGDTLDNEGGLGGIRDLGLLESAVMMPQQQFDGKRLHPSPASMAAAYLFHIAGNHPFIDGNKRVAAMAAFVFLDVNGYELTATPKEFETTVFRVAAGAMSKHELTAWFRTNISKQA